MSQQSDCSFALWAGILHLGDPLLNAIMAVNVAATIQSCQLIFSDVFQANRTELTLLHVRHFLQYLFVHVHRPAQAGLSALTWLQVSLSTSITCVLFNTVLLLFLL